MDIIKFLQELDRAGIIYSLFISASLFLALPVYLAYPPMYIETKYSPYPEPEHQLPASFVYALIILLPIFVVLNYVLRTYGSEKNHDYPKISIIIGLGIIILLLGLLLFDFSAFLFNFTQDWSPLGIVFKVMTIVQFVWTTLLVNTKLKPMYKGKIIEPLPADDSGVAIESRKGYSVKRSSNIETGGDGPMRPMK